MYRAIEIQNYPNRLEWSDELGIGYLQSTGYEYGEEYWKHYLECSASEFGKQLTKLRLEFVRKHVGDENQICDIGIGSGRFVELANCKGTDVNPFAIEWLKNNNRFAENVNNFKVLTMWDVLEHIDNPNQTLSTAEHVFISTPIYQGVDYCLKSKHFKPKEHIWYFTDRGVKAFMDYRGFSFVDQSDFETVLGREDILSYYFKRK